MSDGEKPVEEQETSSKVEMLKTMISVKKKQGNYARWFKLYGGKYGVSPDESRRDWGLKK